VQLPLSEIDRYANGRAGRFVPRNLADVAAFCQPFPTSYVERQNLTLRMHMRRFHSSDQRLLKKDRKTTPTRSRFT